MGPQRILRNIHNSSFIQTDRLNIAPSWQEAAASRSSEAISQNDVVVIATSWRFRDDSAL